MSGIVQTLISSWPKDAYWSSVSLLLPGNGTNGAQNNTFLDASANNFTITRNGNTTQGTASPFTAAAPYSAAIKGGSMYFDGTGDYLTAPNNTAFDFGSGSFTIEMWFFPVSSSPLGGVINKRADATIYGPFGIGFNSSLAPVFVASTSGSVYEVNIPSSVSCSANAWNHIAATRSGNTFTIWVNGQSGGTASVSGALTINTDAVSIGAAAANGAGPITGYLSNLRVVKGTTVYTGAFTPPTAPLTAISGTSLLLLGTNAGIIDNAMLNDLETVGNAQISTTQSKFGGSSIAFDGTGDWLLMPNNTSQQFGTGDFTIEGWFYLSAINVAYGIISKGTAITGWSVNITSGNKLQFSYTASNLTGSTTLSVSTWYYFAVVRSGSGTGNLKIYLNGSADATSAGAVTDNFNQTSSMYVGADRTGGSALNGYIDDLRITKGVARYTANFIVPAAAFPIA